MAPRSIRLIALAALAGCGGTSTLTMTAGPRARLIDSPPRAHLARRSPVAPAEPPVPGLPFADTPLTAFAEQIAELALAAAEGRPLPAAPIPTRTPLGADAPEVELWPHGPRPRSLSVIAVAIEVEMVLKRGVAPRGGAPVERWGALRTTLVVNRNGLRVVSLRPAAMSESTDGGVLPPGLEGLEEAARAFIAHLRAGDLAPYALTEDDRRLLGNDEVWAQIHEDGPPLARAREVAPMLVGLPDTPLAYRLDDIGVLARDEHGQLHGLSLELDPRDGSFALSTAPLVSVRRLWPQ